MAKSKVKVKNRWKQLLKRVTPLGEYAAHVGILASHGGNAVHEGGDAAKPLTLLELAAIHEFGSPAAGIPERSFIRASFNDPKGQAELKKLYAKFARAVVSGRMKPEVAVDLLGMKMVAMIRNRILQGEGIPPPNAASTIAKKGSSRPLVDTGQLVNALTHEVRPKK